MEEIKILEAAVASIRKYTDATPEIAIVLGSGLGDFADSIENAIKIDYSDIEGFFKTAVPERAIFGISEHNGCCAEFIRLFGIVQRICCIFPECDMFNKNIFRTVNDQHCFCSGGRKLRFCQNFTGKRFVIKNAFLRLCKPFPRGEIFFRNMLKIKLAFGRSRHFFPGNINTVFPKGKFTESAIFPGIIKVQYRF